MSLIQPVARTLNSAAVPESGSLLTKKAVIPNKMEPFEIAKMLAVLLSATGSYLVALNDKKKRLIGFTIWIVSNIIWTIDSIMMMNYTQTFLWIYYNLMCLLGIKNNWK